MPGAPASSMLIALQAFLLPHELDDGHDAWCSEPLIATRDVTSWTGEACSVTVSVWGHLQQGALSFCNNAGQRLPVMLLS